ncbi:MAG: MATE family efflux transporter [Lachnospiraceae bacterium]|nr:MATE family efflux transporter [Lachnospiraceae bacterium]
MLVQALYNVVDSIFVARISENALTAVTLAFPMQNFMFSIGAGTGVGVNAMLSRALGEKKFDESDLAANNGLFLTFISAFVFMFIGLFLSGPFIATQTGNPEIIAYGKQYLGIICVFSYGLYFQMMFERLLQSTGLTLYSMVSQIVGAVTNIILDPIMIFGLFGLPALGVRGAALATVIGQSVAATLGLMMNLRVNKEIRFSLKKVLSLNGEMVRKIYAVGVPSILMMSIGSIMTYCMNKILIAFSNTATAVFGVYFKLQSFFFLPVFGLNNGLIPVLAYNYGARRKDRVIEALKFSVTLALVIMAAGTLVMNLFPKELLGLFNASQDMMGIGVPALRIISLHFPVAAAAIIIGSTFQAFAQSIYSLITSIARQLVALIPAAWLLSLTGNVNNVWWAFMISEVVSLTMTLVFFRKLYREKIEDL